MNGLQEAARHIAALSQEPLPFKPRFEAIEPKPVADAWAVDGSLAVLVDNSNAWVVAVRALALHWPTPSRAPETTVHATLPALAQEQLDTAFAVHGFEAPSVASAQAWAEALQSLAEFVAARDAIGKAEPGSLLMVDGALAGLPRTAQQIAQRINDLAANQQLILAGVSKRSQLEHRGVPLVSALCGAGPACSWASPVPGMDDTWVVKLHGRAEHAFRVDGAAALPALAGLSNDAVYVGYPFPLAAVHNAVTITHQEAQQLRQSLDDEVRRIAGPAASWLDDFHTVLDQNV